MNVKGTLRRLIADAPPASATASVLLSIIAVSVALRGFIGLVPTPSGNLATWITDVLTVICGLLVISEMIRRRLEDRSLAYAFGIFAIVGFGYCLLSPESWSISLIALRNHVLYAVLAVYASQYLTVRGARRVESLVRVAGVAIAGVGVAQYALRAVLPIWLLKPADADLFGYWGTDIARANGLVGNTIVYAAYLLLILALWWVRVFTTERRQRWVAAFASVVVAGAVLATFSRMAIVLAACLLVGIPLLIAVRRGRRALLWTAGVLVGGAVVAGLSIAVVPPLRSRVLDSWVVRELFSQGNASVTESTDLHFEMIRMSLERFFANPILGIGFGTQTTGSSFSRTNPVITDGAHWATLAEGGAVLSIVTVGFIGFVFVRLIRVWWHASDLEDAGRAMATALYIGAQFGIAGFLNSGFYGKTPFVTLWIVVGCALVAGSTTRVHLDGGATGLNVERDQDHGLAQLREGEDEHVRSVPAQQ